MQDPRLVKEIQQAFATSVKDGVIDLDLFLPHRSAFNLLRLEDLYEETKGIIPPFRQSDFFILFVKQGAGKRSVGHHTFNIQDNSLVVIPKRVIHAATYTGRPVGYLVSFNSDFFLQQSFSYKLLNSKRVLQPALPPYMIVSPEQAIELTDIFEKIIEECNSGFEEKKQMIAVKLLELLILCDRYFTEKAACECTLDYSETVQAFNELIENHFTKHRDVQFYAEALHTHPNNLNHIVKKATGLTAKQTIINRIIIEAKYLLVSTSLSVKEIAYELGFEDPNYFYSFFKKEQHATPAHYRNEPV
jgi:AraC-like DNA-binding protein